MEAGCRPARGFVQHVRLVRRTPRPESLANAPAAGHRRHSVLAVGDGDARHSGDKAHPGSACRPFAGELGVSIDITNMRQASFIDREVALFSESNSRLLCEIPAALTKQFELAMQGLPCFHLGAVAEHNRVEVQCDQEVLIDKPWRELREIWLKPLDWE